MKQSRYWNAGGNALNVETAGYALLTQIQLGRTGYAGPIVTYITNKRKGGFGFVSTQVCNCSHCIHNWPVKREISNFKFRLVGPARWWHDALRP